MSGIGLLWESEHFILKIWGGGGGPEMLLVDQGKLRSYGLILRLLFFCFWVTFKPIFMCGKISK